MVGDSFKVPLSNKVVSSQLWAHFFAADPFDLEVELVKLKLAANSPRHG